MKTKILITGLALTAITTFGFAQKPETAPKHKSNSMNKSLDSNYGKICDKNENGRFMREGKNRCVSQSNLPRPLHGKQADRNYNGQGASYSDENKNGICDYRDSSFVLHVR